MYISSISNLTFPNKICNTKIKDTDIVAKRGICQFWINMECNNLNHIDYKYLQGSASHVVIKSFYLEYLQVKTSYL